jgi:hypothetical protein
MGRKIGGSLVLLLGLLLVAGGLVLKFAILPAMAVWPDDVDSTRTYEGTLVTMLNPAALQTMDVANLFYRDVPIMVDRHVTTEAVDGNKALVKEDVVVNGPGGQPIPGLAATYWYAIDRKTTEEIPNFTDNSGVDNNRQGLVIGFPIGTEQRTYQGWSDDLQALMPVEFVAVEDHEGMSLYHFDSASDPAPLKDPAVLAMFPASIPKAALVGLAPQLDLAPELLQGLTAMLPLLPDPIPLSYTYGYETNYWVEPTTGVLIDYAKDEARYLSMAGANVPVFHMVYQATDQSITDAKADADDGKSTISLFGTILPWIAVGLGGLVALGGLVLLLRKRKPETIPAAPAV